MPLLGELLTLRVPSHSSQEELPVTTGTTSSEFFDSVPNADMTKQ